VIVVFRMTQPISIIQRTIAGIGPSGEAPLLPETGSLETQAMARAINALSARLKSAMESRMRLVAAAGHDLRTPMTRMRLRAEFLDDGDREKWIADIDELEHIADSAISLVREETEEAPKAPLRLDQTVSEVIAELRELRFDVRLEHGRPVSVFARPLSLKRALRNLIINAATHGGGATVSVDMDGTAAVVSVEDRGPGIPEPLIRRACEPFFRVDQKRKSSAPGAGLGLAIAKEIIQRNLGRLELTNRQGGGLIQRVELPPWAPVQAEEAPFLTSINGLEGLVEDRTGRKL
jgi:signal transduction histidine kinase